MGVLARPTRTFVMRLQPGLKIRLYGDSELCRLIYLGNFEATERAFLNHFLRPGDVFVDVGANIGLFTLIAAARVGPAGRVVAFEPHASDIQATCRQCTIESDLPMLVAITGVVRS